MTTTTRPEQTTVAVDIDRAEIRLGGRQIVGEDMAVRSAATQAAFAAARAPSATAAQQYGQAAAAEAVRGSQIENLQVTIDTGSFQRGSTLTVTARGYVNLAAFPIPAISAWSTVLRTLTCDTARSSRTLSICRSGAICTTMSRR